MVEITRATREKSKLRIALAGVLSLIHISEPTRRS